MVSGSPIPSHIVEAMAVAVEAYLHDIRVQHVEGHLEFYVHRADECTDALEPRVRAAAPTICALLGWALPWSRRQSGAAYMQWPSPLIAGWS